MVRTYAVLLMAVGCISACNGAEPSSDPLVRIDTIGGTVVVESVPIAADTARLRTRIGVSGASGPKAAVFGRISSVTLSREGTLFVADAQANEVRLFSLDGAYVGAFGGPGQGPGEFGDLYSLGWLADTLAAMDPGNARISLHSEDGAYLGQRRWLAYSGPSSIIRLFSLPPGDLYTPYPSFDRDNPQHLFLRFRAGWLDPDTVGHPEEQRDVAGSLCRLPGGGISFFANPFAPRNIVVPGPGRTIVSAGTAEGKAVLWNEAGDSIRVWSVGEKPGAFPAAVWDSVTAEYAAYRAENPGADCEPDGFVRPAELPRLSGMFFTREGLLVMERPRAGGTRFDFFDAYGVLEQRVDLPERDPRVAPEFVGRRILLVEKDEFDVQYVALYER